MEAERLLVFSTTADAASARELADTLVGERLAACVNILPGITSVFRWAPEGQTPSVEADSEVMLVIKTSRPAYAALESRLRAIHPYELPEIVAVPIAGGLPAFLQWIESETR